MYGQDRNQMRQVFFQAWRHHLAGQPLPGIEQLLVAVALRHPEYHALLADPDGYSDRDYLPEFGHTNPFLHLGMHVAIEEQLSVDQPPGIRDRYTRLLHLRGDQHAAQHEIMECLAEMLWQAGRQGGGPDANAYLACVDLRLMT